MKIAIVKLSAMGDIIHAMVALQFVREKYPDATIDWFVEEAFKSVLEYNPDINNIYTVNLKSIKKKKTNIFKEIKKVREYAKNNYDVVIDAQGLIKSAFVGKLLGKNLIGFDKNSIRERLASLLYTKKVNISYAANTIDRNVKVICEKLDIDVNEDDILNKKPFLFFKDYDLVIDELLSKKKQNIVFVIGSTWESRNYPKEKFCKIANELKQNCLVVWGNEEEQKKALWIEKNSEYAKAMPKIDLNSLKALIGKSQLVIGNDTGPTHMAWAMNIPSITIFGPTPINRVYQTSINKVVKSDSIVNHYKLNKNDFSIYDIDEKIIIDITRSLVNG